MSHKSATLQKRCSRCGELKPATAEYFSPDKTGHNGLKSRCKPCCAVQTRSYRETLHRTENLEKLIAQKRRQHEYNQRYYAENFEKLREYNRHYRANNPEKCRECVRSWNADNPEKRREKIREYSRRQSAMHPDRVREHKRRYRENNLEKHREHNRLRRLRLRAAGNIRRSDLSRLRDLQDSRCAYCRNMLEKSKTHIDHIKPVIQGGTSDVENLCLACAKCNLQKHDKTPEEWKNRWYEV